MFGRFHQSGPAHWKVLARHTSALLYDLTKPQKEPAMSRLARIVTFATIIAATTAEAETAIPDLRGA